jgi:ABC-type uncharacterized transport system permease subunit
MRTLSRILITYSFLVCLGTTAFWFITDLGAVNDAGGAALRAYLNSGWRFVLQ